MKMIEEDLIVLVGTFLDYDVLRKFKEYQWNIYEYFYKNQINNNNNNNNFIYFNLQFNITEIKNIPDGLYELYLSHNKITEIKNLPDGLHELNLYNN